MNLSESAVPVVVVGVDGAGRTHALSAGVGGQPIVAIDPAHGLAEVTAALADARSRGAVVIVDDAHLVARPALGALAEAARLGASVRLSRRPTILVPELGDLDAAVSRSGGVLELQPFTGAEVATVLARVTGGPVDTGTAEAVRDATAGLPALVVATVSGSGPGAGVRARVARQFARTGDPVRVRQVVGLLALAPGASDAVVAQAACLDREELVALLRGLGDSGLLAPDDERLIPVVTDVVHDQLTPSERREAHDRLAEAMLSLDGDDLAAAEQLRAARSRSSRAAAVYARAGERLRFADPAAALGWYELAMVTGADPGGTSAGIVETAVLLGRTPDTAEPGTSARLAIACAVAAAHQGRTQRAADALLVAGPPGPVLAVPALMSVGRVDEARDAAAGAAPQVARLLAEATLGLADPVRAVPWLIEAAEAFEAAPDLLLPDTPHAIAAVVAVAAGDRSTAEDVLERVAASGVGGPYAATRHRLLLAWVRLRAGDHDFARIELDRLATSTLAAREILLVAVLRAGLARRSGEASGMRTAWATVRPVLTRRTVDLLGAEAMEELLVAAARVRETSLVADTLGDLDAIVDLLGRPLAWRFVLQWCRLNVAVTVDDPAAARRAADDLAELAPETVKQQAQVCAAAVWADALSGQVDCEAVEAAADLLVESGLPWEAARLCGYAAIRTEVSGTARRLLERARERTNPVYSSGHSLGHPLEQSAAVAALSGREVEVARLVLAGETYKAIGAQLYLSPKTVEHHVARIRNKLGASNRAELVASLHSLLPGA